MSKSRLHSDGEIRAKSYDALSAHVTMVFTRYLLLACQQRQAVDERLPEDIYCKH